eukprot:Nitzschia sp. Nitz4//scaffold45_size130396//81936//82511//NITZ4_003460-RA/size130396-processed-gene-0.194-mRNA-1//1//CDS//3329552431//6251//frame0
MTEVGTVSGCLEQANSEVTTTLDNVLTEWECDQYGLDNFFVCMATYMYGDDVSDGQRYFQVAESKVFEASYYGTCLHQSRIPAADALGAFNQSLLDSVTESSSDDFGLNQYNPEGKLRWKKLQLQTKAQQLGLREFARTPSQMLSFSRVLLRPRDTGVMMTPGSQLSPIAEAPEGDTESTKSEEATFSHRQ